MGGGVREDSSYPNLRLAIDKVSNVLYLREVCEINSIKGYLNMKAIFVLLALWSGSSFADGIVPVVKDINSISISTNPIEEGKVGPVIMVRGDIDHDAGVSPVEKNGVIKIYRSDFPKNESGEKQFWACFELVRSSKAIGQWFSFASNLVAGTVCDMRYP